MCVVINYKCRLDTSWFWLAFIILIEIVFTIVYLSTECIQTICQPIVVAFLVIMTLVLLPLLVLTCISTFSFKLLDYREL
jgi:hypothetical protein